MQAKSIKGKSTEEIKSALAGSMANGFKPTLAIVFISIKQDRKAVYELLSKNGIEVLGATSCGEFVDGHQSEGEISILLMNLPREAYRILLEDIGDRTVQQAAMQLAQTALEKFENPSLIICSTGTNTKGDFLDGSTLVQTLKEKLGSERIFFGGMAGDDMTFTGSYVYAQDRETDFGIAAIVFNADKVAMSGMAITGWKPMGICRTVTKSEGNKVFTIDGASAVGMYFKYLGREENKADHHFKVFEELGFTFPFITERESGGDTMLITPIKVDHEENALMVEHEMPEGTKFWFSMPPDFDIVDEILDEATELKKNNQADADALLVFSCAGRQPVLGPLVTAENEGLADVWQTPMAGFFTYGEYGRTKKGKQEFHSGACCWVALKEK